MIFPFFTPNGFTSPPGESLCPPLCLRVKLKGLYSKKVCLKYAKYFQKFKTNINILKFQIPINIFIVFIELWNLDKSVI